MSGNLPNIGIIPDIVVNAEAEKRAREEAQKRRAYAEEMGRKEAHAENAVKKYGELKKSGGILAPEDQKKIQLAQSSIKMIREFMKGLDKELQDHIKLSYLIERIRIVQSVPTALEMEICLTKAVALGRIRILDWQERKEAEKIGKYPKNVLFWNGKGYIPIIETPANLALISEFRKLAELVGIAKKRFNERVIAQIRIRANILLSEMIADEKEGMAYAYLPALKLEDGKQLSEGHLLLRLVRNQLGRGNQGAKIICLEAYGRIRRKYEGLREKKRFLPLAFVRAGKITVHIKDKELFDDTHWFLRDVLEGLKYEKIHTPVAAALPFIGSLP